MPDKSYDFILLQIARARWVAGQPDIASLGLAEMLRTGADVIEQLLNDNADLRASLERKQETAAKLLGGHS